MKEIIYDPVRKILSEQRPGWKYTFENALMKVRSDGFIVEHDILQQIQDMGFKIYEISYLEESGIVFSVIEEGLT